MNKEERKYDPGENKGPIDAPKLISSLTNPLTIYTNCKKIIKRPRFTVLVYQLTYYYTVAIALAIIGCF